MEQFILTSLRALVSDWTAITDDAFRSDHLKLCYLWYDEVLFETVGTYDETRFFERLVGDEKNATKTIKELTDIILPLSSRVGPDLIGNTLESALRGYPRWCSKNFKNYTYPEPENAEQYAHNRLLQSIETEHGVAHFENIYDIEQAEGWARVAVDAVLLWERINSEVTCMLQANKDEKLAMTAFQQFSSGVSQSPTPFSLFEIAIPSLSKVSWQKIVKLRRNGGISSLRRKMGDAVQQAGTDLNAAKKLFDEIEKNAIDNIVEKGRPKVKKVAIESILANIPGMVINPFSIFFGIRDTLSAAKKRKDTGWLYLLRDIKGGRGGVAS